MNGWEITSMIGVGNAADEAAVVTRTSPWMIIDLSTDETTSQRAIHLPLSGVEVGDLIEVCANLANTGHAEVWYGTTVANSGTVNADQVDPGRSHSYRYVSGSLWTRPE
jgi:hypothetical protein